MLNWLLVFAVNAVLDVVYAKYTLAVGARRPVLAGLWAMGIIITGGFSIILYTHDYYLLIPAALGAYLGTYYTVKP